jgi:hypothetical protein
MERATSSGHRSGRRSRYRSAPELTSNDRDDQGTRQPLARRRPTLTADLVYDAFFGGGIGGSTIALFFLLMDVLEGRPLYTPSVLGSALFDGANGASVDRFRLDMVTYFSMLHFAIFALLAGALSYVSRVSRAVEGHVLVMAAIVFSVLTAAILAADWLFMPGVVEALGYGQVIFANALTGVAMAAFMKWSHRPGRYGGDGGDPEVRG